MRLEDAKTLLRGGRYEGCYYLSGYVVECGLKACIAKLTNRYDFPKKNLQNAYTHKLTELLKIARLEQEIAAEINRSREFSLNWEVVKDWKEQSRYELPTEHEAKDVFRAVSAGGDGVLRWIKQHW